MAMNSNIQNLINSNRKLNDNDVIQMFIYYYNRQPTVTEKSYWTKKTSQQLETALKPNAAQFKNSGYYRDVLHTTPTPVSPTPGQPLPTTGGVNLITNPNGTVSKAPNQPIQQTPVQGTPSVSGKITVYDYNGQIYKKVDNNYVRLSDSELQNYIFQQGKYEKMPLPNDGSKVFTIDYYGREQVDRSAGTPSTPVKPDDIKNDPEYQNLSEFGKTLIDTLKNLYSAKDTQSQAQYQEALNIATSLADPYKALMLGFAKDSIPDEFRLEKLSTEEKLRQNQERLNEIGSLMKDADLETQQVLGTIAKDYESKITDMQDTVSDAGLTYSSKRSDLERFIKQQNMDLVQSTQRSSATKIRNLEQSKREAEKQETLLKEAGNATLKSIARGAEAKIGTSEFNKLGMTDLGGSKIQSVGGQGGLEPYGGDIEQQRRQMILEQASKFNEYQNPKEIKSLFNL